MFNQKFQKDQKHFINSFQKEFWNDGFVNIDIPENSKKNDIFKKLISVNQNPENYKTIIKEKYKSLSIIDIREDEEFYDEFINFLKEDGLINKLNFITCKKLVPIAIKIRINKNQNKKKNLFFNRHRDTFKKNNIIFGNIPPLINLHIYPIQINSLPENQLKVWPGTHRKFFNNFIDKLQINFLKGIDIKTNNKKMLLFDTSILHAIYPTSSSVGSIRCMFNFLDINQIHEQIEDYQLVSKWKNKLYDI